MQRLSGLPDLPAPRRWQIYLFVHRSDGSTLRELHALLKAKDPGFGGLVRAMNCHQEIR
ncbi:MAG: hypothetical protein Q8L87_12455 [Anaerolineales bacterium]|nr:hypothetical protein [Anaerolineales bacterium]